MNVLNIINEVSDLLDKLDEFDNNVSNNQQNIDYKLSDLYHKLEQMPLNSKNCYRFCKELKSVLIERREFKNTVDMIYKYKQNKLKLNNGIENRRMLLSILGKEEKGLNQPYKNRVYTEEELEEIIGV